MDTVDDQLKQSPSTFEEVWAGDFKAVGKGPLPDDVRELLQDSEAKLSQAIRRAWRNTYVALIIGALAIFVGVALSVPIAFFVGVGILLLSPLVPLFWNAFSNTGHRTRIRMWLNSADYIYFQMEFSDIEEAEDRWFDDLQESESAKSRRFGIVRGGWMLLVKDGLFEISHPGFDFVRSESAAELRSETRPWRLHELSVEGLFQQVQLQGEDRAEIERYMGRLRTIAYILIMASICSIVWIVLSFTHRETGIKIPPGGFAVSFLLVIWTIQRAMLNKTRFRLLRWDLERGYRCRREEQNQVFEWLFHSQMLWSTNNAPSEWRTEWPSMLS